MKKHFSIILALTLSGVISACSATPASNNPNNATSNDSTKSLEQVAPYPKAESGQKRMAIFVDPKEDESKFKVELLVGKTMETDCNRQFFSGAMTEQTLDGWGYNYHVLKSVTGPASTMMACGGKPKKNTFVPVNGEGYMLRYNSKLPIVVYIPQGFELKYRIWSAGDGIPVQE
ncbi:serine protease inhibitor ecotin [Glaciimonas soli]|uniref:Serine protease inhibitor ecotin n=1 Tax=Glaciimonas soli TaxID=2590999 RepID=A0A843YZ86_9BURK|nr:serine protease inhibitor ecotin [Glaciimonas soli]MQR01846.1 serine protease inhibitor ecotin [Glaciimonas soli]